MKKPGLKLVTATPDETADVDKRGWDPGTQAEIRIELNRVLNSSDFDASERNRRFLEYIVEETLSGQAHRIKAYNIATIVFGRDDNFDPQIDPVVRMEAGRLRRSLERFYYVEGGHASIRIELPKGGYVPNFRRPDAEPAAGTGSQAPVASALAIFISPFDLDGDALGSTGHDRGFTRRLAIGLSRFREIEIFTGLDADAGHSACPGDADLILAGEISKRGDALRISATLVDAHSGRVVWGGQTIEQHIAVHGVQIARDRIADRVVRVVVGVAFAARQKLAQGNEFRQFGVSKAWDQYHKYRTTLRRDMFQTVRTALEKAAENNPDSADTLALLSQTCADGLRFGFSQFGPDADLIRQAIGIAHLAVEMAPDSSRAHHAQGIAHWISGKQHACLESLRRAVDLNPNAVEAIADLGIHLCLTGAWDEGLPYLEDALEGGHLHMPLARVILSLHNFLQGDFEKALLEAGRIQAPDIAIGFVAQAIALERLGRRDEAAQAIARVLAVNPGYGQRALRELGDSLYPDLVCGIRSALGDAGLTLANIHDDEAVANRVRK